MYDETVLGAGGRGQGGRVAGGWIVAREGGSARGSAGSAGAFARAERVSRVPKERRALGDCVRQLFTTIFLTTVFFVSPPSLYRAAPSGHVSTRGDLGALFFIWPPRLPARPPALPARILHLASSSGASHRGNGKGAYLRRLRSHNSGRQTGKSLFLSLSPVPPLYPPPPICPGLILFHFSCNLGEALQGSFSSRVYSLEYRLRFRGEHAGERLDLAAIPLSATSSRTHSRCINCRSVLFAEN